MSRTTEHKDPSLKAYLDKFESQEHRYALDPTYIHVSDLFNACLRQFYFLKKEGKSFERLIPARTITLFEWGRAFEDTIKARLVETGVVVREKEVLREENLKIVASPDLRLMTGQIVEVKAKNPWLFKLTKRAPLPQDQFQVENYLWIDQTKRAKILTGTWGERVSYHEHTVHYNIKTVELVKKKVGELREADNGSNNLPGRVCSSPLDGRAILCPVRDSCFAIPGETVKTIGEIIGK